MPCNVFLVEDSGKGASVLLTTSVCPPSSALGRPPCAHAGREERVPTLVGAINKDLNHEFTKKTPGSLESELVGSFDCS